MLRVGLKYDRRLEGTAVTELESVIPFSKSINPRGIACNQFRTAATLSRRFTGLGPDLKALTLLRWFPRNVVQAGLAPLFHADRHSIHPGRECTPRLIRGALRQRGISSIEESREDHHLKVVRLLPLRCQCLDEETPASTQASSQRCVKAVCRANRLLRLARSPWQRATLWRDHIRSALIVLWSALRPQ